MKKMTYLIIIRSLLSILFSSCVAPPDQSTGTITLITSQSVGCLQEIPSNQISEEGILTWQYNNGKLDLFVHVDTQCDTKMIDSVNVRENKITIMLEDTSSAGSECACIFREIFNFRVDEYEDIEVQCLFKPFKAESFKLVIDRNLILDRENYNN
jgi:hypothetical protein